MNDQELKYFRDAIEKIASEEGDRNRRALAGLVGALGLVLAGKGGIQAFKHLGYKGLKLNPKALPPDKGIVPVIKNLFKRSKPTVRGSHPFDTSRTIGMNQPNQRSHLAAFTLWFFLHF